MERKLFAEAWNSACLSRCPRGERPFVELYLEPGVVSERCTEKLPLRVDCIHRLEFGEVSGHRVLLRQSLNHWTNREVPQVEFF